MTDKTPMPFGQYKNIPLADVPSDHLFHLESEILKTSKMKRTMTQYLLLKYINENRATLQEIEAKRN